MARVVAGVRAILELPQICTVGLRLPALLIASAADRLGAALICMGLRLLALRAGDEVLHLRDAWICPVCTVRLRHV